MRSVTMGAKELIQETLRRFGYEIRREGAASRIEFEFWPWVRKTQNVRTVIDIGAHVGEWAALISTHFKPGATYLIEPLASCIPALRAREASIKNLTIFNVALADYAGTAPLFENSYPPSSSLLRVSDLHKKAFPETAVETPAPVQVCRLDDLLDAEALAKNILIKIDVQGLEHRVIRGGRRVFAVAQCVLIEMSFAPMYQGQPLFEEVHASLVELRFRFAGIKNQIPFPESGQPLFAHCLYLRSPSPFQAAPREAP